jgi:hypothetical protein
MRPFRHLALAAATCVAATAGVIVAVESTASAATSVFGYGTPEFVNSAAPASDGSTFFNSDNAGEPSIGVNWNSGAAMYMAGTDTYKVTFDNTQTPPAVTWADRTSPYSIVNLDPILATDHTSGLTLAGGDDGPCAVMSATTTDGGSAPFDTSGWTPTAPCPFTADHPTVGIGPASASSPLSLGSTVAYFCQQSTVDECSHSLDGGQTWSPGVTDPNLTCLSLHGHVKISPDGTAYVPSVDCSDASGNLAVGAFMSQDNGLTWSGFGIPGAPMPADGFDPSVATDSNNRVYESWARAGDYNPVITWSDDHGAHWTPQVDLANTTSPAITASTFQATVAGDSGRAAVAYLATTDPLNGKDPFAAGFVGTWNLYISFTYDGGTTWQTQKVSTDPVQIGEIDAGGTTTTGQRNLLDFMDASLTKDGRVVVAYADGCLQCTSAAGSTDAQATVAYQSAGEGLFSAYDTAAPTTPPASPTVNGAVNTTSGTTSLNWAAPDDGGSPITGYQIYRGLSSGAETPYATVNGTSYTDGATSVGTTYYYRVVASNAVGNSGPSNEVNLTPSTAPQAPTLVATSGKRLVTLSWTTPSNGGAPISGWGIYRGTATGAETLVQTLSSGTKYVDSDVASKTKYFYEVVAINSNGAGARSNEASATPK